MANEEVLGPRKTMFVLVIVVGCFAVLWPRILSPLIVGHTRDQLQPNQFDRDAGCCDVMFGTELTVLELINEVCSSAVNVNGKLSPIAVAECRKTVNETCGLDIAALVKQSDNIGKSSRMLVQTMQNSNSSCLREHFGVPQFSLGPHTAINSWTLQDTIKQERPPIRGAGPHPALRERGRAIPPGTPPAASPQTHIQMPPNVRVRNSPLQGYFELDIKVAKPPPIPGMRPPLGSPGGPVPAPKSSMGFVMPIYTICIIVFFVYTISKLFFKRATIPYEPVTPDPHFRRRVFRDDSRSSPDKLVVTAISGLVAEVQQQMETGYAQNQQRQDVQDNHTRPYTNGTIIHNSGPVHIFASEYQDSKDKAPEPEESSEPRESPDSDSKSKAALEEVTEEPADENTVEQDSVIKDIPEGKEGSEDVVAPRDNDDTAVKVVADAESQDVPEPKKKSEPKDTTPVQDESEIKDVPEISKEDSLEDKDVPKEIKEVKENDAETPKDGKDEEIDLPNLEEVEADDKELNNLIDLTEAVEVKKNGDISKTVEDFLKEEAKAVERIEDEKTKELLEEAIEEDLNKDDDLDQEKSSVKVMGMEVTAHSADGGAPPPPAPALAPAPASAPRPPHEGGEVKSIFLETAFPPQARVLVADFQDRPQPPKHTHSPMVVSGKMTLSLIQDAPRDTPERDPESTMDDFTTASALTQPAEKEGSDSEEEVSEEEVEIEEVEEEIEVEESEEEVEDDEDLPEEKLPEKTGKKGTE